MKAAGALLVRVKVIGLGLELGLGLGCMKAARALLFSGRMRPR